MRPGVNRGHALWDLRQHSRRDSRYRSGPSKVDQGKEFKIAGDQPREGCLLLACGIFPASYMRMQELMRIIRLGACLAYGG
jgi:hypothetical protein